MSESATVSMHDLTPKTAALTKDIAANPIYKMLAAAWDHFGYCTINVEAYQARGERAMRGDGDERISRLGPWVERTARAEKVLQDLYGALFGQPGIEAVDGIIATIGTDKASAAHAAAAKLLGGVRVTMGYIQAAKTDD